MTMLTVVPPRSEPTYDGLDLANEMLDFVIDRLPRLALDDSLRPTLQALLPGLAAACDRPPVLLAGGDA
jgi:hypothetical protein